MRGFCLEIIYGVLLIVQKGHSTPDGQRVTLNSKEFAHLVDGAIEEAKELGIQTDTPEQLARYKEEWSK